MNERIKELKLKAIKLVAESYPTKIEDFTDGLDERVREKAEEKFAELIVRECANIVNSLEQYEGQGDCSTAEYIKEHFGVEE